MSDLNQISKLLPQLADVGIVTVLFTLAYFILFLICIILFIRVTTRGIRALDIYISKNMRPMYPPNQQNFYNPQQAQQQQQYHNPNNQPPTPPRQGPQ